MKLAIITGGSKGLGKAFVDVYSDHDFEVIEFSRSGSSVLNIRCDFVQPETSMKIVENTFGDLSRKNFTDIILINNVGTIEPIGPLGNFDISEYIQSININFTSAVAVTGLFAKYFQANNCNKTIVNISSGAAKKAKHGWSIYCGVKAGLEHFVETFALEQQSERYPIHSIIANPGIVDTGMQETIRGVSSDLFPEKSRFIDFKQSDKLLSPGAVAKRIYEESLQVNGTITRISMNE